MSKKKIALVDKDLDGFLSLSLYSLFYEFDKVETADKYSLNINKGYKLIAFDVAYDKLVRIFENSKNSKFKELVLFDHHYTSEFTKLLDNVEKQTMEISLFEDSTYEVIKKHLKNCRKDKLIGFERKYRSLITFMKKVENERFNELTNKDKYLYFNYFKEIDHWIEKSKNRSKMDPIKLLDLILEYYNNLKVPDKKINEIEKNKRREIEENIDNLITINENKVVVYFEDKKKEKFRYNIPYFYHNKEILVIIPYSEKEYKIIYRLNNLKFWKEMLSKYKGGGRVVSPSNKKKRALGVLYLNKKDLENLIYEFEFGHR